MRLRAYSIELHKYTPTRAYIFINLYRYLYIYMVYIYICIHIRCVHIRNRIVQVRTKKSLSSTLVHCNTHCNTLQHTATHCNILQHPATHCNTPIDLCNTRTKISPGFKHNAAIFGLNQTKTQCIITEHCNTPQHTEYGDLEIAFEILRVYAQITNSASTHTKVAVCDGVLQRVAVRCGVLSVCTYSELSRYVDQNC